MLLYIQAQFNSTDLCAEWYHICLMVIVPSFHWISKGGILYPD